MPVIFTTIFKIFDRLSNRLVMSYFLVVIIIFNILMLIIIIGNHNLRLNNLVINKPAYKPIGTSELLAQDIANIMPIVDIIGLINNNELAGISLELYQDNLNYCIYFADNSQLSVDAYNGKSTESAGCSAKNIIQSSDRLPTNYFTKAKFIDAIKGAKQQSPDKKVIKIELGVEASLLLYAVHFDDNSIAYISSNSGQLVTLPKSDPIIYTTNFYQPKEITTADSVSSEASKKWRDKYKSIKKDRRQKIEALFRRND